MMFGDKWFPYVVIHALKMATADAKVMDATEVRNQEDCITAFLFTSFLPEQ